MPVAVLCLASYEKGHEFLREAKRQGATVYLLTSASLKDKAQWPVESIDEIFCLPDQDKKWDPQTLLHGVCYLARTRTIDRIVALDDFDLEKAAMLREHLRVPGMGDTTTRFFRDKLAMRMEGGSATEGVSDGLIPYTLSALLCYTGDWLPPWRATAGVSPKR